MTASNKNFTGFSITRPGSEVTTDDDFSSERDTISFLENPDKVLRDFATTKNKNHYRWGHGFQITGAILTLAAITLPHFTIFTAAIATISYLWGSFEKSLELSETYNELVISGSQDGQEYHYQYPNKTLAPLGQENSFRKIRNLFHLTCNRVTAPFKILTRQNTKINHQPSIPG